MCGLSRNKVFIKFLDLHHIANMMLLLQIPFLATLLPWILKRHERRSNLYSAKVNSKIAGSMRWLENSKLWAIPFECGGLYYLLTQIEGIRFQLTNTTYILKRYNITEFIISTGYLPRHSIKRAHFYCHYNNLHFKCNHVWIKYLNN